MMGIRGARLRLRNSEDGSGPDDNRESAILTLAIVLRMGSPGPKATALREEV